VDASIVLWPHGDFVGLAGLIVGLIALGVVIYGIWDVREQVKFLVTLERNRVFAKVIHTMVWRVVERTVDVERFESSSDMHEFTMLARALDSKQTLNSAQEYANKETLALAKEMVNRGLAKWRDDIDENKVSEILKDRQNDKNAAALRKIFGRPSLSEPNKDLLS
jgi:hypothetical protein